MFTSQFSPSPNNYKSVRSPKSAHIAGSDKKKSTASTLILPVTNKLLIGPAFASLNIPRFTNEANMIPTIPLENKDGFSFALNSFNSGLSTSVLPLLNHYNNYKQTIDWDDHIKRKSLTGVMMNNPANAERFIRAHSIDLHPEEIHKWKDVFIVRHLSGGTFGQVYLTRISSVLNGEECALKLSTLKGPQGRVTAEQQRNLLQEIFALRRIQHENIIRYYGVILEYPRLAVITEFIPGGNVFDLLYSRRMQPRGKQRLTMCVCFCSAIAHLHTIVTPPLIHRDLKTQNVLVQDTSTWKVKLCDFGNTMPSRKPDGSQNCSKDRGGSPRYMAPECFVPMSPLNDRIDVWSAACCLIEMLSGSFPFEHLEKVDDVMRAIVCEKQSPRVPAKFPFFFKSFLQKCFISAVPENRPNALELNELVSALTPEIIEEHNMHINQDRLGVESVLE